MTGKILKIIFGNLLFIACMAGLGVYIYFFVFTTGSQDREEYQKLLEMSGRKDSIALQKSQQNRRGVRKDVFVDRDNQRLHMWIKSERSQLNLARTDTGQEVVEHMQGVLSLMQESLQSSTQTLLFLDADSGTYYYHRNLFETDKVRLTRFVSNGHDLPDAKPKGSPVMTGSAGLALFSFQEGFEFSAKSLRMQSTGKK